MATHSAILLFFVLGMAGILKVDSSYKIPYEVIKSHIKPSQDKFDNLQLKNTRENLILPCFLCNDKGYSKQDFRIHKKLTQKANLQPFYPYFRDNYSFKELISAGLRRNSLRNRVSKFKPESMQILHEYVDFDNISSKNAVGSTQQDNTLETHPTEVPDLSTYIVRSSPFDISADTFGTGSTSLVGGHFASDLKETDQNTSDMSLKSSKNIAEAKSMISESVEMTDITTLKPEAKSSSFEKKVNLEMVGNKNEFITSNNFIKGATITPLIKNNETKTSTEIFTDTFSQNEEIDKIYKDKKENSIDKTVFPENFTSTSHSRTPETVRKNIFPISKTNSPEKLLTKSNNENSQTETTVLNTHYFTTKRETTPLGEKTGSTTSSNNTYSDMFTDEDFKESTDTTSRATPKNIPIDDNAGSSIIIHSTNNEDESTISPSTFFTEVKYDTSTKIKSSSLGEFNSRSTQHFQTESTPSWVPTTLVDDDNELTSESSSSFKLKSTTSKTVETKLTSENLIPSSVAVSTQSKNVFTTNNIKESFSTESSSKAHSPSEAMTKDHIIEIPAIHTARVVITSFFLVIALIAITVLAIYIFRLKRREVQYDQLRLIP